MVQDTATVADAALRLGLSEHAVRKRIQRGALPAVKDATGRWRVVLDGLDTPEAASKTARTAVQDTSQTPTGGEAVERPPDDRRSLYETFLAAKDEEIAFLRAELTARTEELRRKDHIIAGFIERLPELPAGEDAPSTQPAAPGATERTEPASGPRRWAPPSEYQASAPWWRRWWQRVVGGE